MNPPKALPRSSIRVALKLPFRTDEVAEYLFRSDVLPYWLSQDALLEPKLASPALLPQAVVSEAGCQSSMSGTVTSLAWPTASTAADTPAAPAPNGDTFELVVTLDSVPAAGRVTFRLAPREGNKCRIRIEHSGLTGAGEVHSSVKLWQSILNKIGRLMTLADRSRRRERQAVIVVHGIGEQRPGQFLRQFVESIFDQADEKYFIKPDYISPMFEMHTATVPRYENTRPTTDVYEYYWAHLIRDTTVAQVYDWLFRLLISRRINIPQTLISLVWALRATGIATIIAIAWLMTKDVSGWLVGLGLSSLAALPALATMLLKLIQDRFIVEYAGDAARYLEPKTENIARRQEIREIGAQMLDALHESGRYSRIIVYGHSLGSVIAYDMLSYSWARKSRIRDAQQQTSNRALRALEDLLNPRPDKNTAAVSAEEVQPMQYAAWLEYRRNGFEWLVSDFVTAGSPLSHARWILNLDAKTQFADLLRDRSFPTCPPQTETIKSPKPTFHRNVFTFTHAYVDEKYPQAKRKRSVQVPHHSGLFALTRWTNIYFPYSGLINGDPIAGPLVKLFGAWIRDIQLTASKGFAHTRYTDRDLDPQAVSQVRDALNLPFQRPLTDYAPPAELQEALKN